MSAGPGEPGSAPPAAGYSGTPLPRKLGIKAGARLALIGAPDGFDSTLGSLPDDVTVSRRLGRGSRDVIVAFFSRRALLERRLPRCGPRSIRPEGCGSPGPSGPPASTRT